MRAETARGEAVALASVWQRARAGELLVVRELCPVEERPWEDLHRLLDARGLVALTEELSARYRREAPTLLPPLVRALGCTQVFYFERQPNVRIHLPYEAWKAGRREFLEHARKVGDGKVSPHGPHRDSDHGCPVNAINLWLALGRVSHGNGMCIYPRAFGGPDDYSEAVTFALSRGDAVVFAGEHLHTSELNVTDESRSVVSFRLTPGRPLYRGRSLHDYVCSAPSPTRWLRDRLLRARALLKRAVPYREPSLPPPRLLTGELPAEPGIWAVSDRECVVRTESGRSCRLRRHCPHQGTDLAAVGVVRGERVVCPWHNLALDPEDGC